MRGVGFIPAVVEQCFPLWPSSISLPTGHIVHIYTIEEKLYCLPTVYQNVSFEKLPLCIVIYFV